MGTLRIIAGTLKGRRLRVPPDFRVRPTPDRVREALFSILGTTFEGGRVLDAFAGTGALGFEALSRGAADVTFVEADTRALVFLRRNAETLEVTARCLIHAERVETLLDRRGLGGGFDLVLADPPYASGPGESFLRQVAASGILLAGARVVFQRDVRTLPAPGPGTGLEQVRTARYGRTCLDFYSVPEG